MRVFSLFITCGALLCTTLNIAHASKFSGFLGLSVGHFDFLSQGHDEAVDFRVEYRPNVSIVFKKLKPWAGIELTHDASLWAGGGLLFDFKLADKFYVTPSIGVGYYASGMSQHDLHGPIAFRSQLEFAYQFDHGARMGIAVSHISNANLDNKNPGAEILSLYYHIPIDSLFKRSVAKTNDI